MSREDELFVFNPLPFERTFAGPVAAHVRRPRGGADDQTAGRHFQDRDRLRPSLATHDEAGPIDFPLDDATTTLPPTSVPGYGYTTVSTAELQSETVRAESERGTLSTDRYTVTFDRDTGGITSLQDSTLGTEWVDRDADYPLGGFVHETVPDRSWDRPRQRLFRWPAEEWHGAAAGLNDLERGFQSDWHASRSSPDRVRNHRVFETPVGYDVYQILESSRVASDITMRYHFPSYTDGIVVEASWEMSLDTHPEATYLAFPFDIHNPTPYVDVGGQAVEPGTDQLPESVKDYFTVQRWAALGNGDRSVIVGCPINPLVQFGDFSFGEDRRTVDLSRAMLLGWVTNNYWDTNFRAHQPGVVRARYHLHPQAGGFEESTAHRLGAAAAVHEPLVQNIGEPPVANAPLGGEGQVLDLPEPPILVDRVRPAALSEGGKRPGYAVPLDDADMVVVLRNASDGESEARIGDADLHIDRAYRYGALTDGSLEPIERDPAGVTVTLEARRTETLALDCSPST